MRSQIPLKAVLRYALTSIFLSLVILQLPAQSSQIQDYVILAGSNTCTNAGSCGVSIGPNNTIYSGQIGSYNGIVTSSNLIYSGSFYANQLINLSGGNQISGSIYVANPDADTNTMLISGSSTSIGGNLLVNGNISINSGSVSGTVTHPAGSTYSGPVPNGGEVISTPVFNALPLYPIVQTFIAAGNGKISNTQTITPGAYGEIALNGGRTLTFSGPGVYTFSSIDNKGSFNTFNFDFKNQPGEVRINVHNDVDLNKLQVIFTNGGDASRIFLETHGNGSSTSAGTSFKLNGGSTGASKDSEWKGTVWAPYGAIEVGGGSDKALIQGALFSNKHVQMNNNVNLEHVAFNYCSTPITISATAVDTVQCSLPTITINATTSAYQPNVSWTTNTGTDDYGFSGLPGGYRDFDGSFFNIRDYAFFWSATENNTTNAWSRYLSIYDGLVDRYSNGKSVGASVRCLRD